MSIQSTVFVHVICNGKLFEEYPHTTRNLHKEISNKGRHHVCLFFHRKKPKSWYRYIL
jgi:hypothetical protein